MVLKKRNFKILIDILQINIFHIIQRSLMKQILLILLFLYTAQAELLKEFDVNGLVKSEKNYIKRILRSEKYYKDGKKHGVFKSYFPSGEIFSETSYKEGQLDGLSNTYFKTGRLKYKAYYILGEKEGTFKKYNKVGVVLLEENFKMGKRS